MLSKAVKKLFQIVQEKKPKSANTKNLSEAKRLEKEYKRLQLDLSKEKENYAKMHKQLNQEIQALKEDLDKKEQDLFKYRSLINSSVHSGLNIPNGILSNQSLNLSNSHLHQHGHHGSNHQHPHHHLSASPLNSSHNNPANLSSYSLASSINNLDDTIEYENQDRLENWLSIPNKRNIKKHGWKKLYVVLRKRHLYFYNSLRDKESQEPYMTIDLEYLFLSIFLFIKIMIRQCKSYSYQLKESVSCETSDTN